MSTKVTVLGASGGIGQPLSMLLKLSPYISELACYDIANTPGVAADLSHVRYTNAVREGFLTLSHLHSLSLLYPSLSHTRTHHTLILDSHQGQGDGTFTIGRIVASHGKFGIGSGLDEFLRGGDSRRGTPETRYDARRSVQYECEYCQVIGRTLRHVLSQRHSGHY